MLYQDISLVKHKCIRRPERSEILILRFLILVALLLVGQFVIWYLDEDHIGQPFLFWMLSVALGYKLLQILYQWYNYIGMTVPSRPESVRNWRVDILTTYVAGEPKEMLIRTLQAMVQVQYPHTTYLCDEADDPALKEICKDLGVIHVYRGLEKTDAKAGNINYTLRHHARGEIVVILDPDHIPVPEFLHRVLPHFENPEVGFVQCIQAYYNQGESLVARGAAQQTYMFYGPLMLGMQRRGTVQAIGANCTFRRTALDSIGGHANGLCEDMHTSMRIHALGWKSVYVPESLTRGRTPSNISAYYHQQLKWSRGAFQLLFEVYPRIFKGLTWKQRVHYFLIPLYFLVGVICFIDIGVPIFSLLTYHVPLFLDFEEFAIRILPLLVSVSLVRHYAQRFVLDQQEEGFHFMGGILRVGTWWVYLLGFLYAVLRIDVPYIPTNKTNTISNHWLISVPNLSVIFLSSCAIFLGLRNDYTPYSWVMAGFAAINITLLSFVVISSQQKLVGYFSRPFKRDKSTDERGYWFIFRYLFLYKLLRNSVFAVLLILVITGFSFRDFLGLDRKAYLADFTPTVSREIGERLASQIFSEPNVKAVAVFSLDGSDPAIHEKTKIILANAKAENSTPFIKLLIKHEPAQNQGPSFQISSSDLKSILISIREFQRPVLLQPLFGQGGNDTTIRDWYYETKKAARAEGAGNLSLVSFVGVEAERQFPDVIDVLIADYSTLTNNKESAVSKTGFPERPILLVGGSDKQAQWTSPTIKVPDGRTLPVLGWIIDDDNNISPRESDSLLMKANELLVNAKASNDPDIAVRSVAGKNETSVVSREGAASPAFSVWKLAGDPFYVKGIVYNPEHTWRDGRWPLTRRRLKEDLAKIKAMGANTISRDHPTVYDRNILTLAEEAGLYVMYGFTFDPATDYLRDTVEVEKIKRRTMEQVESVMDEKALLAWNLGANTWEMLAQYYYQPYLTEVRLGYMRMIHDLAKAVREIDPVHPVLTGFTGGPDLHAALDDLEIALPYIDAVGVNATHPGQLEHVQQILDCWDGDIPHIINSFGPKTDWQNEAFATDGQGRILEPSSYEKGRMYSRLWQGIEKHAGRNLGGLAYCWRDRYEGTATLSGITDADGRLKPSYFSLKEAWTGEPQQFPLADLALKFETIFSDGAINLVYGAMSANNLNKQLTYKWIVYREEYLDRVYSLRVDYKSTDSFRFRVTNEFNQHIARTLHLPAGEPAIWFYKEKAKPLHRIYLIVHDDENHVVTASYPVYSGNHE